MGNILDKYKLFVRLSWKYLIAVLFINIAVGVFRSIPIFFFTKLVAGIPTFSYEEIIENSVYWAITEITSLLLVFGVEFLLVKWKVYLNSDNTKKLHRFYTYNAKKGEGNHFLDSTSDIEIGINTLTSIYERVTRALFTIVFVGSVLASIDLIILSIYIIGSFVMLLLSNLLGKKIKELGIKSRDSLFKISHFLQDMYNGLFEMRNRGQNTFFISVFSNKNKEATRWGTKLTASELISNRLYQFFLVLLMSFILLLSGVNFLNSKIKIEDIAAIMAYGKLLSGGVVGIINSFISYQRNHYSINKYLNIINKYNDSLKEGERSQISPYMIKIQDLSVEIEDKKIVSNVNLEFEIGKITILTGENGVGKSTIFEYFFNNLNGNSNSQVLFGNNRKYKDSEIDFRKFISGMPQEHFLINDSIKNNIMLGKEIDELSGNVLSEVEKVIGQDINRDLKGLKTPLSGGQIKVVMFARSLVHDTPFMLLDEPTVHLDEIQRKYIVSKLHQLKENHGIVVITHDKELLTYADKIIRIENTA